MKDKRIFWILGGVAAAAASAYAIRRVMVWLAWREEQEFNETERQIEQYEDYVHANGHKRRRWWWGKETTAAR